MKGLRQTYHVLEIILDTPDVLLVNEAQVEARFGLFGDSAILDS